MTASIEFEAPTALVPSGRKVRTALAAELTAHPGKWMLLGTWKSPGSARQLAYMIRQGHTGWQMFGAGFEAECHTVIGEYRIYVRYVGRGA